MRRTILAVLAIAVFSPLTAQAQQWTAEQQEVWETLEACWDAKDLETTMGCIHDDYVAWPMDGGVPLNKVDLRASMEGFFATQEAVWAYRKPLSIDVRGEVSTVIYVVDWVSRYLVSGEETSGTTNWTEVFVKNGDRWQLLADHGTEVGGN